VIARPVNDIGEQKLEAMARRFEDSLLRGIEKNPEASMRTLATILNEHPEKVRRTALALEKEKLIRKNRGGWQLTPAGQKELNRLDMP